MAEFHFVEDYERHVTDLLAQHSRQEAMELAVGGNWAEIGSLQASILRHFGLRDGHTIIDLGCGSGRTAAALQRVVSINYIGVDIIQRLLDYASEICPDYNFVNHRALSIPAPDKSAHMICSFSLFTHLLHHETYLYLEDAARVLKTSGLVVFSFLEMRMPSHWPPFMTSVEHARSQTSFHLNQFMKEIR